MASVVLAGESLLHARGGWCFANAMKPTAEVLGINRQGQPVFERVTVEQTGQEGRSAYVGTSSVFGLFSNASNILHSDGTSRLAGEIVEAGEIAEAMFENHISVIGKARAHLIGDILLKELTAVSAFGSETEVSVCCRDASAPLHGRWKELDTRQAGPHRYCMVERSHLKSDLDTAWSKCLVDLVATCYYVKDLDRLELERDLVGTITWCLSALNAETKGYVLSYDLLQHSAYVYVALSDEPKSPIIKGRTAFFGPLNTKEIIVSWNDRSWHPIANGFLVGAV